MEILVLNRVLRKCKEPYAPLLPGALDAGF